MLDYAASLKPGAGKRTFEFIKKVLTDQQAIVMTYGEQLIQEGRQEGMQTRSLEIARNMFHAGEPIERVARWTGLSEASIRSL